MKVFFDHICGILLAGIILFLTLSSCVDDEQRRIIGKYSAYWGETDWQYTFKRNNVFIWECEGHFGFEKIKGKYSINGDSLFLFYDNSGSKYKIISEQYFINGDSCIIDISNGYYYCRDLGDAGKKNITVESTNRMVLDSIGK